MHFNKHKTVRRGGNNLFQYVSDAAMFPGSTVDETEPVRGSAAHMASPRAFDR